MSQMESVSTSVQYSEASYLFAKQLSDNHTIKLLMVIKGSCTRYMIYRYLLSLETLLLQPDCKTYEYFAKSSMIRLI